jgi:protein required for attachment to host cells
MGKTWILVADSSGARFFSTGTPIAPFDEFDAILHPEGVAHERELTSDRPGRSFDSFGEGRHAMESQVGPKAQEAKVFAKQLCDRIEAARSRNEVTRVVLVAPPDFLGLLRDALPEKSRRMVELEIDKNLVKLPAAEIRAHLPEKLYSALS